MEATDFVLERSCPEEHRKSEKIFISLAATVSVSPKILQSDLWSEMFSAKYCSSWPILNFFHCDFFCSNCGQCGDNCKSNLFLERKKWVAERPRSLNPGKAVAMAICPIIVHFIAQRKDWCMTWHVNLRAQLGCAETISANVLKSYPSQGTW